MSLKQQISSQFWVVCLTAAIAVFGSGRGLSAFEQTPAQQPAPVPQPPSPTPQQAATQPSGSVTKISVDDAVRMALENNLGIQSERLGPQIGTLAVAQARGVYAPFLISTTTTRKSTEPPGNFLTGTGDVISDDTFRTNAGLRQFVPWGGGSYQFTLDASRQTTNAFTNYNPQLGSNFAGSYTQPLLRGFKIDTFRQQVLTSRNNQVIADIQLREQITLTSYAVRFAYYDLVGAIEGLKVAQLSLDLARQSLKDNETRVEVGTMAPIDIIEAQAEVASNEEAVIQAEARISTVQDRLRALVLNPTQADFWTVRLEPGDAPTVTPVNIDIETAVQNALANRTDIARQRKLNDNVEVNLRFNQNQRMPALDMVASYNLIGLAGTQFVFDPELAGLPAADSQPVAAEFHGCALRCVRQRLSDLERPVSIQLSDRPQRVRCRPRIQSPAAPAGVERSAQSRAAGRDRRPRRRAAGGHQPQASGSHGQGASVCRAPSRGRTEAHDRRPLQHVCPVPGTA